MLTSATKLRISRRSYNSPHLRKIPHTNEFQNHVVNTQDTLVEEIENAEVDGKSNDSFQNHVVNTQDTLVEEIEHAEVDGKSND